MEQSHRFVMFFSHVMEVIESQFGFRQRIVISDGQSIGGDAPEIANTLRGVAEV